MTKCFSSFNWHRRRGRSPRALATTRKSFRNCGSWKNPYRTAVRIARSSRCRATTFPVSVCRSTGSFSCAASRGPANVRWTCSPGPRAADESATGTRMRTDAELAVQRISSRHSRRRFLEGAGCLSALAGGLSVNTLLATPAGNKALKPDYSRKNIYERLGIRPLINAAGTYTALSASLMPREVLQAMDEAARHYVSIPELQQAVGQRIAALLRADAALVTAGAAAALTLGTAACVTGTDPEKIRRLPETAGMKNEVLIQKAHRFGFEHAVRAVGAKLIEVETHRQLESAINEKTAMMLFLNHEDPKGQVRRKEFVEIGKRTGIPTFNDAAVDVPPVERLSEYLRLGFDLVAFSGGKGLRGPQCSGLLLWRPDLIE